MKQVITADELRKTLNYDPETGIFTWLVRSARCIKVGDKAGCSPHSCGYCDLRIRGIIYKAHRLAWLYMTGEWPEVEIDHINGNKSDNRFANLREATRSENEQNRFRLQRNNTSGTTGVSWHKRIKKWQSSVSINGKKYHIGYFPTHAEATNAANAARLLLHPYTALSPELLTGDGLEAIRCVNGLAAATRGAQRAGRVATVTDGPDTRKSTHGRSQKVVRVKV